MKRRAQMECDLFSPRKKQQKSTHSNEICYFHSTPPKYHHSKIPSPIVPTGKTLYSHEERPSKMIRTAQRLSEAETRCLQSQYHVCGKAKSHGKTRKSKHSIQRETNKVVCAISNKEGQKNSKDKRLLEGQKRSPIISPYSKSTRQYNPNMKPPSNVRRKASSFKKKKRKMTSIGENGTKKILFSNMNNDGEMGIGPNHDSAFVFQHFRDSLPTIIMQESMRRSVSDGEFDIRSKVCGEGSCQELVRSQSWYHVLFYVTLSLTVSFFLVYCYLYSFANVSQEPSKRSNF